MRFALVLYVLASVSTVAVHASAEPEQRPTATLTHMREVGAESCPDEQELKDAISGRLGYLPFQETAPRRIRVSFAKAAGKLTATLVVERDDAPPKTRKLESAPGDCIELAQSVALAISVAIDPLGGARPAEPAPPLAAEPAPAPTPPPPEPAPAKQPDPPRTSREIAAPATPPADRSTSPEGRYVPLVSAIGRAAWGELPKFSPGVGLGFGVRVETASLSVWGDLAFPVSGESAAGAYEASLIGASLRGCWERTVFFCSILRAARLSAEGLEVDRPRSAAALIGGVGLGTGLSLPISRSFQAAIGADLLGYPLSSVTFELDGREVWEQPLLAVAGWLSLAAIP